MRRPRRRLLPLTGLEPRQFATVVEAAAAMLPAARGRRWRLPLQERLLLTAVALRTNLTVRQLAAVFDVSKSQAHRVVDRHTRLLATLLPLAVDLDRRWSWTLDGTLVPTRDHRTAGRSKNYRYSTNAQVLARRTDLTIVAIDGGGPGRRNDVVHYRDSHLPSLIKSHGRVLADGGYRGIPELCTPRFEGRRMVRDQAWRRHRRRRARAEHAIARLKDWQMLRDHRRAGKQVPTTFAAVAYLHNINTALRDIS